MSLLDLITELNQDNQRAMHTDSWDRAPLSEIDGLRQQLLELANYLYKSEKTS